MKARRSPPKEFGTLLYDEASFAKGRAIRARQVRLIIGQAIIFLIGAALISYILWRYDGAENATLLGIAGLCAAIFGFAMGAVSLYGAANLGYNQIYEGGIVVTRARTSKLNLWPFAEIEKVCRRNFESGRSFIIVVLKKGSGVRKWGPRELFYGSVNNVGEYDKFVAALRGRVAIEGL